MFQSVPRFADGCAAWTGRRTKQGYGLVEVHYDREIGVRWRPAHAVSYEVHRNLLLPVHEWVYHVCGNRACIESSHLVASSVHRPRRRRNNDDFSWSSKLLDFVD